MLHLTRRALNDLEDIHDYSISEWGEKTTLEYMQAIEDALKLLTDNPGLLKINDRISSRFRVYNVRRHYLICDIFGDDVFVLSVKHVSMNLLERLRDSEPLLDEEVKTLIKRLK